MIYCNGRHDVSWITGLDFGYWVWVEEHEGDVKPCVQGTLQNHRI